MDACDIEQARRRGDGILEGRVQRRWRLRGPGVEEMASWRAWAAWAARQRWV